MGESLNRKKSKNYLVSLIVICLLVMGICIFYLKLQFEVISSSNQINVLQSQLIKIKEKNNAIYNEKENSKNITEKVKSFGNIKRDAKTSQEYNANKKSKNSKIIQYKDIPRTDDIK